MNRRIEMEGEKIIVKNQFSVKGEAALHPK